MAKIIMDTHMHSKASDGLWTPSQVVQNAKARGLKAIALTDHDTTFGIDEVVSAGLKFHIPVIPGIEIDAYYKFGNVKVNDIELIGLGINTDMIQKFTEKRAEARANSLRGYLNLFNEYINSDDFSKANAKLKYSLKNPHELSLDQILAWRNKCDNYPNPVPFLSKMDIVNYFLEYFVVPTESSMKALAGHRKYSSEFRTEYAFLFRSGESKPTFYEAINAVNRANGTAVLAHPGISRGYYGGMIKEWLLPKEEWFSRTDVLTPFIFIKDLKAHGLDGVEMYNYSNCDEVHKNDEVLINLYFKTLAGVWDRND